MAMTIFASGVSQQISTYLFTTAPEFKLSLQSTTDVSLGISPTCISVDRTGQALYAADAGPEGGLAIFQIDPVTRFLNFQAPVIASGGNTNCLGVLTDGSVAVTSVPNEIPDSDSSRQGGFRVFTPTGNPLSLNGGPAQLLSTSGSRPWSKPLQIFQYGAEVYIPDFYGAKTRILRSDGSLWNEVSAVDLMNGTYIGAPQRAVVEKDTLFTLRNDNSLIAQSTLWDVATGPSGAILAGSQYMGVNDGYLGVEVLFPTPSATFSRSLLYVACGIKDAVGSNLFIVEYVPPTPGTPKGTFKKLNNLTTETAIRGMAFSPDGKYLVVGTQQAIVYQRVGDGTQLLEVARNGTAHSSFAWL